jgi:AraC-like DNA-binding protein
MSADLHGAPSGEPHEEHRQRIERALGFIAANLDRALTVAEVAKVACLSEFHFHRVFAAAMNEPVGAFITRKRLETAALMLAYHPSRNVTEIALATGYSSTANFSKAFSAFFGCRPTDVRAPRRRSGGPPPLRGRRAGRPRAPAPGLGPLADLGPRGGAHPHGHERHARVLRSHRGERGRDAPGDGDRHRARQPLPEVAGHAGRDPGLWLRHQAEELDRLVTLVEATAPGAPLSWCEVA